MAILSSSVEIGLVASDRSVMAMTKVVALSKLRTDSKRFSVRVTLQGEVAPDQYWDEKTSTLTEYVSIAGVEPDTGARVSLAFFGEAQKTITGQLAEGQTVTLGGGMPSIRHEQSVSTVAIDLKFNRFASVSDVVGTVSPRMPALMPLESLMRTDARRVGDIVIVYISSSDYVTLKNKKSGVNFERSSIVGAEESVAKSIEIEVLGPRARVVERLLADAEEGATSVVIRGVYLKFVKGGWRGTLCRGGVIACNTQTPEEIRALAWAKALSDDGKELSSLESIGPVFKRPELSELRLCDSGATFVREVADLEEGDGKAFRLHVSLTSAGLKHGPLYYMSCPEVLPGGRVCKKRVDADDTCERCQKEVSPVPLASLQKPSFQAMDGVALTLSALGPVAEKLLGASAEKLRQLEKESVEKGCQNRLNQVSELGGAFGRAWDVAVFAERVKLVDGRLWASTSIYKAEPCEAGVAKKARTR